MAIRQRTRSARLLVVTLVAASLAIITVDYRGGEQGPLDAAGRVASSAIAPLQQAVSNVVQPVSNFFSSLAELPSLSRRNGDLQAQVDDLRTVQQLNQALTRQIETLEQLLGLQTITSHTIAARVIGSGVSNFEWDITIDRGSEDGIEVDMPVVTGASDGPRLVGRVIRVTPISSIVQLVIDRDFAVAGRLSTSQEAGLVLGRGEEDLRMGHLRPGIEVGETEPESVFTVGYEVNGQPGLYPAGILIGTVSRAFSEPDAVESFVTIRPAVDFSTLQYVLVIAPDPRPAGRGAVRRTVVIVAVTVTALLLQTTVFPELTLLGVKPELLYLVTVVFAALQGPAEGAVVGFVGGLAQDFMLNMPKGITALTLTILGYTVGLARQYIASPSPLLPAVLVALGTAGGVAFHQAVAFLLGEEEGPFSYVAKVVLLTAVYGAVLTPIFFPVLRRAATATHAGRVVRF